MADSLAGANIHRLFSLTQAFIKVFFKIKINPT